MKNSNRQFTIKNWIREFPVIGDRILNINRRIHRSDVTYEVQSVALVVEMRLHDPNKALFSSAYHNLPLLKEATEEFMELLKMPSDERSISQNSSLEKISSGELICMNSILIDIWDGSEMVSMDQGLFRSNHFLLTELRKKALEEVGIPRGDETYYRLFPSLR